MPWEMMFKKTHLLIIIIGQNSIEFDQTSCCLGVEPSRSFLLELRGLAPSRLLRDLLLVPLFHTTTLVVQLSIHLFVVKHRHHFLPVTKHITPIIPGIVPTCITTRACDPSLLATIRLELFIRHSLAQIINICYELVLLNV